MMEKTYENPKQESIARAFEGMRTAETFEVQSSGGKQHWCFKYDKNGNLLVQPPNHTRYTKVLYPTTTLVAIAKSKEYFEMYVTPLKKTEIEEEINSLLLMVKIEAPCFA